MEDEVEITTMDTDWKSGITGADLSVVDSEDGIEDQAAVDFLILDEDVQEENTININRLRFFDNNTFLISFARVPSISVMMILYHTPSCLSEINDDSRASG